MQPHDVRASFSPLRLLMAGLLLVLFGALLEKYSVTTTVAFDQRNDLASAGMFCGKGDFVTGSVPFAVSKGDFNADGILDLVVANSISNTVSIFVGTAIGNFGAKTDFGTGASPTAVAVGDFNLDGKLDLVTANANDDTVSVLLGTGSGSFGEKSNFVTGGAPRAVAVGDFNGDSKLDLAIANTNSNTVSILLGAGTGSFGTRTDFVTSIGPRSIAVGDFNGNGKLDLAVANSLSNSVSILLGTGTGSFGPKSDYATGVGPFSIAVGDFNGDSHLDLATANTNSDTASILLGSGSGVFGAKTDFSAGDAPFSLAIGDFNADGKLDLAIADVNSDRVTMLSGTGTGSFSGLTELVTGTSPRSVAAADFNGDGKPDLAVANEISSSLSVLLNACTNNPPRIEPTNETCVAGAPPANLQIAVITDSEDSNNALTATVNGGASATVNGVSISGITVGTSAPYAPVRANVAAACNATTATFTVRVTDTGGLSSEVPVVVSVTETPLTITCPSETIGHTDSNVCTGVVMFAPTVTSNCIGSVACSPASGSKFPKGVTTVTCTASDASGTQASCSFQVRVIDSQRPICTGPGPIVKSTDPDQCSAVVTFNATASDNCPAPLNPSCAPSSGFRFPKGSTMVVCHFVDASANEQTCIFHVTVVDSQPPGIATPGAVSVAAPASCPYATNKVVTYAAPAATDNCAVQSVVCNPPSGSTFPVGATAVNCTATDTSGNIATCSFPVNVYSFCIQDEMNDGNVVLVNASTGDFSFCCNGVPIASGRGTRGVNGCVGSIDQTKGDRRVHIEWDTSANSGAGSGFAYVKKSADSTVCQITDKQLTNNGCQCSTQSPPSKIVAPSPPK